MSEVVDRGLKRKGEGSNEREVCVSVRVNASVNVSVFRAVSNIKEDVACVESVRVRE